MIRHVFTLVWNRKRANALIITEILVSFLVLCTVVTTLTYYLMNWRRPLGFDYDNVLEVSTDFVWRNQDPESRAAILERLRRIEGELRAVDAVENAALARNTPYSNSASTWQFDANGRDFEIYWGTIRPEVRDILRLEVVTGRWLERGDEKLDWVPIVVNRRLAHDLFETENPLGRPLPRFEDNGQPRERRADEPDYRVVGVVSDYRRDGEFSQSPYIAFAPFDYDDVDVYPSRLMLLRLRPGTNVAIEERLSTLLHGLAPDWQFEFEWLPERRRERLRDRMLVVGIAGTVAGFLLVMVGMGLVGVLWQNVSRRTRELGLRRALGATAPGVRLQILGELVALATVAVVLGSALFMQAPILGIAHWVSWKVYALSLVASLAILYYLVILCGLYPSWLATRILPARALQYE